jgi:hypothetical protein
VKCEECSSRRGEERKSIEHCRISAYKYFIHYVSGQNETFLQFINRDNAVRFILFIKLFVLIGSSYKYIKRRGRRNGSCIY